MPTIEELKFQISKLEKNIEEVEVEKNRLEAAIEKEIQQENYKLSLFNIAQSHEGAKRVHLPSTPSFHTLLHHCYSCYENPNSRQQYMINEPISQIIGLQYDTTGNTLLHLCIAKGELEAVEKLLKLGADPRVQNNAGSSALEFAEIIKAQKESDPRFGYFPADEILETIQQYFLPPSPPPAQEPYQPRRFTKTPSPLSFSYSATPSSTSRSPTPGSFQPIEEIKRDSISRSSRLETLTPIEGAPPATEHPTPKPPSKTFLAEEIHPNRSISYYEAVQTATKLPEKSPQDPQSQTLQAPPATKTTII